VTFGFDERSAMFGVTPVENQFILELLPEAKAEYVKIYLYGLMKCYYPGGDTDPDQMARELNTTPEEILSAYRYWERRGAVRRISDKPPQWQYLNLIQRAINGGENNPDPEYENFSNAIYDVFDNTRRLHGNELVTCFEWHEDLGLPTEVVVMLLKHMAAVKGKQFKIRDAEKVALEMANENIRTIEDAEEFLSRDRKVYDNLRQLLRKMGKRYLPSEVQIAMYRKWIREWHFTPEAIEAAFEQTGGGDPNMAYLESILKNIMEQNAGGGELQARQVQQSAERADGLRKVIRKLGQGSVNPRSLQMYDEMKALYPEEIILTAAGECRDARRSLPDLLELLQSWKKRGLETPEEIRAHLDAFHEQTMLLKELQNLWGTGDTSRSKVRRDMLTRWTAEWGMSRALILKAAEYAATAKDPMGYLNSILASYREKGIRTPEDAEKDHAGGKTASGKEGGSGNRGVNAQRYSQRDYSAKDEEVMKRFLEQNLGQNLAQDMTENNEQNGGESDA